jgi:hypothetical protein
MPVESVKTGHGQARAQKSQPERRGLRSPRSRTLVADHAAIERKIVGHGVIRTGWSSANKPWRRSLVTDAQAIGVAATNRKGCES